MDKWMNKKKGTPLPDHTDIKTLTNQFLTFFSAKIAKIRENLDASSGNESMHFEDEPECENVNLIW